MPELEGWWTDPRLAFAEGAAVGYANGMADALEVASDLFGPWKFDAAALLQAIEARSARDPGWRERRARSLLAQEQRERARRGLEAMEWVRASAPGV